MNHECEVRVRFCETDCAGHVNNTSYFIYLEEARGRFFEDILPDQTDTVGRFIIASAQCDFLNQAYFKQRLKVATWVSKIGHTSMRFSHEITSEAGERIAKGEATIVCFSYEAQQSEPIPADLRMMLEEHLVTP
ncbi:thioesterase family protein [Thalassobacillus sp. CUG 92003]|uniref:acyl-CoA thioesterase n=1 Tax=Thalassobacillus sp. CUG 92003 TaxID=2736641 RepID=UPI0015E76A63|nr:acyl-CoA thioesterase [Thalassobacillus sp. CUG 92003]